VAALVVVEAEHRGDGIHDVRGGAGRLAALQPDVVLRAHAGKQSDLLPAEALHPTAGPADGKAGVGGGDPVTTRAEELANGRSRRLLVIHATERKSSLAA
jgi:hypothetical protein